jgi:tetratricopeptide (TPR) repeat protein
LSYALEKRLWLSLLFFSAVVRAAFFLELKDTDLANMPLLDSDTYHQWATRLVAGDWGRNETYWMGPLYPHLLAAVYFVFGVGSKMALVLQLVLSLLNIWLLRRFALGLFSDHPWAREISLLAAAVFAFYAAPVFYAGNLLMATLSTTLFLLVGIKLVRAVFAPSLRSWFVLGLLTGLAGLTRGNVLLLLPLMPLVLWRAAPQSTTNKFKHILALGLGAVLMITPVTVRNLIVADDFVVLTSNGGVNLLIGQQVAFKGMFTPLTTEGEAEFDPSMEATLERELGRDLKGSEVSRILAARAWQTFGDNASAMPLHYFRKAYRFWSGYELPQIISYDYYHREFKTLWVLPLSFVWFSALGIAGLWLLPQRARWVMIILIGGYFLSLLPFFPTSRYRQPIVPLLAVSMAFWLIAVWRTRHKRLVRISIAASLVIALWPQWAAMSEDKVLWQVHLHKASRASKLGNTERTETEGRLTEAARPGLADTPYHLSLFWEDLDDRNRALEFLKVASERAPRNRLVPYRIGRNFEDLGLARRAVAAYEHAAALDTAWSYPWYRSGLVLQKEGRQAEALRAMKEALKRDPGSQRIRSNLASLYAESGELDLSLKLLLELTQDYPSYVNAWYNRALSEHRLGQREAALASLKIAQSLPNVSAEQRSQIEQLNQLVQ